jgi:hypothetical protein
LLDGTHFAAIEDTITTELHTPKTLGYCWRTSSISFQWPMQSLCVGATRWSAVDGVVEVPCFGLHLTITFFRITYYRKYFL